MSRKMEIKAVYENGVFIPLKKLEMEERKIVVLKIGD